MTVNRKTEQNDMNFNIGNLIRAGTNIHCNWLYYNQLFKQNAPVNYWLKITSVSLTENYLSKFLLNLLIDFSLHGLFKGHVSKGRVDGSVLSGNRWCVFCPSQTLNRNQTMEGKEFGEMSNNPSLILSPCLSVLSWDSWLVTNSWRRFTTVRAHQYDRCRQHNSLRVDGRCSKFKKWQDTQNWNSLTIFVITEFHSVLAIKMSHKRTVSNCNFRKRLG